MVKDMKVNGIFKFQLKCLIHRLTVTKKMPFKQQLQYSYNMNMQKPMS